MSISISVSSIFEILNFFAFIGLIVFLFRTQLKKPLTEKINEKADILKTLHQQSRAIQQKIENLITTITQQNKFIEALKKRLAAWNMTVEEKRREKIESTQNTIEKIEKKITTQTAYYAQTTFAKKVTPSALEEARKDLQQEFSSKEAQNAYLQNILSFAKKEIQ